MQVTASFPCVICPRWGFLQDVEELPRDWQALFKHRLWGVSTQLVPEAVGLYARLGVVKAPLTLMPPSFEVPLPPLVPATFPPVPREPQPPPLELFDLDEAFASDQVRPTIGCRSMRV